MRFHVTGYWKLSAEPAALTVAADSEDQARDFAGRSGIIVLDVAPADPTAATGILHPSQSGRSGRPAHRPPVAVRSA